MGTKDTISSLVSKCSVPNCQSVKIKNVDNELKFHVYPKNDDLRRLWLEAVGRNNLFKKSVGYLRSNVYVCSLHFSPLNYTDNGRLMHHSVPTLNLNLATSTANDKKINIKSGRSSHFLHTSEILLPVSQAPGPQNRFHLCQPDSSVSTKRFCTSMDYSIKASSVANADNVPNCSLIDSSTVTTTSQNSIGLNQKIISKPPVKWHDDLSPLEQKYLDDNRRLYKLLRNAKKKIKRMESSINILKKEERIELGSKEHLKFCLSYIQKVFPKDKVEILSSAIVNTRHYTKNIKEFSLTLFNLSPSCYQYLSDKLNLPSVSSLRRYEIEKNINGTGDSKSNSESEPVEHEVDSNSENDIDPLLFCF